MGTRQATVSLAFRPFVAEFFTRPSCAFVKNPHLSLMPTKFNTVSTPFDASLSGPKLVDNYRFLNDFKFILTAIVGSARSWINTLSAIRPAPRRVTVGLAKINTPKKRDDFVISSNRIGSVQSECTAPVLTEIKK